MAYVSVTTSGNEYLHDTKPTRKTVDWENIQDTMWYNHTGHSIKLPKGSIKKLIGREITFNDGPINLKSK
jgi:hypothetical protein